MIKGQGEVVERNISTTEVEEAIRSKSLFVIEAPDYSKSESEKKKALNVDFGKDLEKRRILWLIIIASI